MSPHEKVVALYDHKNIVDELLDVIESLIWVEECTLDSRGRCVIHADEKPCSNQQAIEYIKLRGRYSISEEKTT